LHEQSGDFLTTSSECSSVDAEFEIFRVLGSYIP
jgi:hypothetical protein